MISDKDEIKRLAGIIENAPHDLRCDSLVCGKRIANSKYRIDGPCTYSVDAHKGLAAGHVFVPYGPCNCWKSDSVVTEP